MSAPDPYPCWIDGQRSAAIAADLRALQYGDGVFRTMLRFDGVNQAEALHLHRLQTDAAALGMALSRAELDVALADAAADGLPARCVLRCTVLRAGQGRGYAPPASAGHILLLSTAPLPDWPAPYWHPGIRAGWLRHRQGLQSGVLAGVKHMNRLDQVIAAGEVASRGLDEGICCDLNGQVVGGSRSNIFWVRRERLYTPRLENAGVRGVTRSRILDAAASLGLSVSEIDAMPEDVDSADEILFCNSLMGIWPVRQMEHRQLPQPQLSPRLLALLAHPLAGHA